MTYRSFSSPNELLDLLIQRFNIPDPEWYEDSGEYEELDETTRLQLEIDKKRFRNGGSMCRNDSSIAQPKWC